MSENKRLNIQIMPNECVGIYPASGYRIMNTGGLGKSLGSIDFLDFFICVRQLIELI